MRRFSSVPKWVQTAVKLMVAKMVLLWNAGVTDAEYQAVVDDVMEAVHKYHLSKEEVFALFGDPLDPAQMEAAKRRAAQYVGMPY